MIKMNETVFLNGEYVAKKKAYISPDDRGFYFADGVYEVIRCFKGNFFCFEEHMSRLKRSLSAIRINYKDIDGLSSICHDLIVQNDLEEKYADIYLQITRGVCRRMHSFPESYIPPTIYICAYERLPYVNVLKKGIKAITRPDIRWLRCDIKSVLLLPNTLMFQEAREENASECIFVRDGVITEASHSNVMGVKDGIIFTHPDCNLILPGITKKVIFDICKESGIHVKDRPIIEEEIYKLDELFVTSTGNDIMPVVELNNKRICNGVPGPVTRMIQTEFFRITYKKLGGENTPWF
jgi:D-alanine transaminase